MGIIVLLIGLAVLGFGVFQHMKGKRILAAPFKGTGDLAKSPVSDDPKGAMSTEGKVVPPAETFFSPASKTPCLAYELKIERLYEKTETTQDGTKTVKGSETLTTVTGGAIVGLDDGSGVFHVDFSKGADFDNMKDGFKKEVNGHSGSSHIMFGEYAYDVPVIGSDKGWTTGFKATEKYVPVEGSLFVLGKVESGKLVKPGWRSLMASSKGRDGLLGSIQKKKKFSFIGGGIAAVAAIPLMLFGPSLPSGGGSSYCKSAISGAQAKCSDTVNSEAGESYTWTITEAGKYEVHVKAPKKKVQFYPELVVLDAKGEEVAMEYSTEEAASGGQKIVKELELAAGVYTVKVRNNGYLPKGGYSFDMELKSLNPKAPAAAPAAEEKKEAAAEDQEKTGMVDDVDADEAVADADDVEEAAPVAKKVAAARPAPKVAAKTAPVAKKAPSRSSNKNLAD